MRLKLFVRSCSDVGALLCIFWQHLNEMRKLSDGPLFLFEMVWCWLSKLDEMSRRWLLRCVLKGQSAYSQLTVRDDHSTGP
jgi:hypothetical protein